MKASQPLRLVDSEGAGDFSRSIVLVSSIAGITEAPGLFAYASAKHGVIGLMRALRPWAPQKYNVRVNALCPWATDTQLLGVKEKWVREKMPMNTPADVGRIMLQCSADRALNGKAIFITGGRFFDTEEGVDRTLPQWMGEQNAKEFLKGQELLGLVSSGCYFYVRLLDILNNSCHCRETAGQISKAMGADDGAVNEEEVISIFRTIDIVINPTVSKNPNKCELSVVGTPTSLDKYLSTLLKFGTMKQKIINFI
jgi:hypothetical protein